jgi:amidohydrolase
MVQDDLEVLHERLEVELPAAVRLRQQLHARPDRSGEERRTRDLVLSALPGGDHARPVADTGAVVRVGGPGAAVAVRAELDALPVTEATGLPWASQHPGLMHACGHDVHLAALVALARAVDGAGGPVPLLAVLQPREETYPSGARDVCQSGVLETEGACAAVAAHVQPLLPGGTVSCTPGAVNASSDEFVVTVSSTGGHAAYPHLTGDPVVALAHVVVALQTLISRGLDPMVPGVLSVTTLQAGTTTNVIPDVATARGTFRTMQEQARRGLLSRLATVVTLVAESHGCTAKVEVVEGEPVLVNDARIARDAAELLPRLGLRADDTLRSAGSDDFSYFSARLPSMMMFVGTYDGGRLHTAGFAPGDEQVGLVARALLAGYLAAAGRRTP